jgi:hypothetical protein
VFIDDSFKAPGAAPETPLTMLGRTKQLLNKLLLPRANHSPLADLSLNCRRTPSPLGCSLQSEAAAADPEAEANESELLRLVASHLVNKIVHAATTGDG